jgi:hypothetical protein
MAVTSKDMPSGKSTAAVVGEISTSLAWRAGGLMSVVVGLALWLIGARFTTLGAPSVIEMIFGLFRIDVQIPLPIGWALLTLTIVIGAAISLVEFGCHPRRSFFGSSIVSGSVLFLLWLGVNAADLSSTYIGVTTPFDDSWPITIWIAKTQAAATIWTTFLTYVPELLIIAGVYWLLRGRFK